MKKISASICAIILLIVAALLITGCVSNVEDDAPIAVQPSDETGDAPADVPQDAGQTEPQPEPVQDTRAEMLKAYSDALGGLLNYHTMPDGSDCGYDANMDPAGNQFAIFDIDNDGRDELIIAYTTTVTAGQVQCIFGYDESTKQLKQELSEYPLLTFFDNGVIKAGWSHNQGLAGDFWPYSLYKYAPDTDSYARVGMVDAWDKSFFATDFQGEPFPDDKDVSGTGVLYYIMGDEYAEVEPVDASEYNEWYNSYLSGSTELQLTYSELNDANIAAIK